MCVNINLCSLVRALLLVLLNSQTQPQSGYSKYKDTEKLEFSSKPVYISNTFSETGLHKVVVCVFSVS